MMKTVTYNENLKQYLTLLKKATEELVREDSNKTVEQFRAEIEFVKNLLKETEQTTH